MTAALVSGPSHGVVGLDASGGFTYTPAPGFLGVDSFSYRAVNVNGPAPNIATVVITVEAPPGPQPPVGLVVDAVVGQRVTVRFTAPGTGPNPIGYVVKGGVLPGQVLEAIPTGNTAPIFTFEAPIGSFFIRVHTLTNVGESEASNEVLLHVGVPVPPSPPTSFTGSSTGRWWHWPGKIRLRAAAFEHHSRCHRFTDDVVVAGGGRERHGASGTGRHLHVEATRRERRRFERGVRSGDAHNSPGVLGGTGNPRELPGISHRQHALRGLGPPNLVLRRPNTSSTSPAPSSAPF